MEDLFNKIYTTEFLFEVFTGLDEGAIKDKIIELNCDREKIEEWVSEIVANGGI